MIQDTLTNAARYEVLSPRFAAAFAYLRTVDGTQAMGRHDIDGDQVFALVQTYATKPQEKALFEAHRKYIDIQFIYSGRETILWAPLDSMKEPTLDYTVEKDAGLWKLVPEVTELHMQPGHLAILYPEDAHAPCVQWGNEEQVFKVVIKVAVD